MDYQNAEKTSGVVQLSIEGVEQLEIYFGKYIPQFFYSLLAPLTLFVVISFISWKTALVFMLCVPLIPMSIIAIMKVAKRILKEYWNNYANLGDTFLENLQGLTTLKVYGQDEQKHIEMNEEAEGFRRLTLPPSEFFIPLRLLGSYFHIAMNGMAASDRIFALLDTEEENIINGKVIPIREGLDISVEKVNFSYDGKRQVLKDISFDLMPGGLTAIVGESGSGKSTMAALLLAQKKVRDGKILLNGVSLSEVAPYELYQHVSLVSAHSHIFKGTLRDNLLMAKPDATQAEINEALKTARLDEFITSLPNGLETEVSENGSSLSGGQKQRLALARVILANRQAIIFDEATSNIDVESEEAIWDAIYDLSKTKTIMVISHRLASVRRAKAIHVFKMGELVESGTHEELMKKDGVYANMVSRQQQLESIREVR